jgi:hypothetical protein
MFKRLAILTMILSVAQAFVPATGQTPNRSAPDGQKQEDRSDGSKNPSQTTPSVSTSKSGGRGNQPETGKRPTDYQNPSANITNSAPTSESWSWHDKVLWVANLMLAAVGLLGIGVGILTLWAIGRQVAEMRAQTIVAQTSANAALQNVKALIVSERPWLLVTIKVHPHDPSVFIVRAKNKGKTPAELHEGHCACSLEFVGFTPPDNLMDPFLVPLQNLTVQGAGFEIRRIKPSQFNPQESLGGMKPKMLFVYGKILYWDTFTDRTTADAKPYVTQWCFTYHFPEIRFFRTANAYTKNT